MKNKKKFTIYLILLMIWMTVIFMFSNQSGNDSTNLTNGVIDVLLIFFKDVGDIEQYLFMPIRKLAHFMEYAVLGILAYKTLSYLEISNKNIFIYGLFFCIFYSLTDEFHQLFVSGRGASIIDCMIDSLGAILAITILTKKMNKENL